jgi:hypothetical protein
MLLVRVGGAALLVVMGGGWHSYRNSRRHSRFRRPCWASRLIVGRSGAFVFRLGAFRLESSIFPALSLMG